MNNPCMSGVYLTLTGYALGLIETVENVRSQIFPVGVLSVSYKTYTTKTIIHSACI